MTFKLQMTFKHISKYSQKTQNRKFFLINQSLNNSKLTKPVT